MVAKESGVPLGFISAYRRPDAPQTLFVWQVGVAPEAQGRGIASRMLRTLIERKSLSDITRLETTISPSNKASRALFDKIAKERGHPVEITPFLEASAFDLAGTHEAEELISFSLSS